MNHQISYKLKPTTEWSTIEKLMQNDFAVFTHNPLTDGLEEVKNEKIKIYCMSTGRTTVEPLVDLKDFDYYYCIYNGSQQPSVFINERNIIIYEHRMENDA